MLNVDLALKKFEAYIQSEGRKILTQQKRNDTKDLYNLKWVTTKKMPNSISIYFLIKLFSRRRASDSVCTTIYSMWSILLTRTLSLLFS